MGILGGLLLISELLPKGQGLEFGCDCNNDLTFLELRRFVNITENNRDIKWKIWWICKIFNFQIKGVKIQGHQYEAVEWSLLTVWEKNILCDKDVNRLLQDSYYEEGLIESDFTIEYRYCEYQNKIMSSRITDTLNYSI